MSIAQIKRFMEAFNADPQFREAFRESPMTGMQRLGLPLDPERLKPVWDKATKKANALYKKQHGVLPVADPELEEYRRYHADKVSLSRKIQSDSSPGDPRLMAWRHRQMARLANQVLDANASIVVHSPVAFELSVGCSVGCYFCSLEAPKLSEVFRFTPENTRLWRDTLEVMRTAVTPAGQHGFCYWATDPLDNPDYEKFCLIFAEVMGRFPQTTTANALVAPERTKALLRLSQQITPSIINRFSILTTQGLRESHRQFTAEELRQVELVTLNTDGDTVKTKSGRFYKLCKEKPEVWSKETRKLRELVQSEYSEQAWNEYVETLNERTCACVSGFLVNMVQHTVKLITPCVPDDLHPKGFFTFAEGAFEDGAGLEILLERMIRDNAPKDLPERLPLAFRKDLKCELTKNGFVLVSKLQKMTFENPERADYVRYLGEQILTGKQTATTLGLTAQFQFTTPSLVTYVTLNDFFQRGVFEEVPATPRMYGTVRAETALLPEFNAVNNDIKYQKKGLYEQTGR